MVNFLQNWQLHWHYDYYYTRHASEVAEWYVLLIALKLYCLGACLCLEFYRLLNCTILYCWRAVCGVQLFIGLIHCREEGCIGKYTPRGPRDFPRAGILHPEARGVQNPRTREISRAEGGVFSDASRLEAVYVHSLSISREVLILTLYGCISWYSLEAEMACWVKWSLKITLSNTLPAPGSVRINTAPWDSITPYTP